MVKTFLLISFLVLFVACTGNQELTSSFEIDSTKTIPHIENSLVIPISATPILFPTIENREIFTPTPIIYTVIENDTLTGIARKFDISLEALLAVNPNIANQVLSVGMVIIIPPLQPTFEQVTPAPLPVSIQQTNCFPNKDNSLGCVVLVKNESSNPVQGLSINLGLKSGDEMITDDVTSFASLDLLPPGKAIPLGFHFNDIRTIDVIPVVEINGGSVIISDASHFISIVLIKQLVEIEWRGLSARIQGEVKLNTITDSATEIRILASAFDKEGNLIGFRLHNIEGQFSGEGSIPFEFEISSMGPAIESVELLVEAIR